jgi:translation initiation factor 1
MLVTKQSKNPNRLVYSTDGGRLCPQCLRPQADCVCGKDRPAILGDGSIRIRRESKGRGGKTVTVVSGLPLAESALRDMAKQFKKRCGVGGSTRGNDIEIQGDQRQILRTELEKMGYQVKLAGG